MTDLQGIARAAALETAPRDAVGGFVEQVDEGDSVYTLRFESKLKGYRDWRWAVVIFAPEGQEPTISEVLLLPGETSLIAPDWVPWSERLADYRALQAELEAQAALEAEDSEDVESEDDDESEDDEVDASEDSDATNDESETVEPATDDTEGELAVANSDETDDTQDQANSAGKRPKRLFGWRKARVSKKNKN